MKHLIYFALLFLTLGIGTILTSCDAEKLFKKPPVIEELNLSRDEVSPLDTVYAEVKATNPEDGVLSYHWSVTPNRGSILDPIDRSSLRWVAPYAGGTYLFNVEVSNAYKKSESNKSVRVIVSSAPIVQILTPKDGDYLVQLNTYTVQARASHENGISKVSFYVEDSLWGQQSASPNNEYQFTFIPDTSLVGKTSIKVEAIPNSATSIGADSIEVSIEPILPKKR